MIHLVGVELWGEDVEREGTSRVTWEIEPVGDSCRLTVTHDQLAEGANSELYGGWPMILSGLKTLLETGGRPLRRRVCCAIRKLHSPLTNAGGGEPSIGTADRSGRTRKPRHPPSRLWRRSSSSSSIVEPLKYQRATCGSRSQARTRGRSAEPIRRRASTF